MSAIYAILHVITSSFTTVLILTKIVRSLNKVPIAGNVYDMRDRDNILSLKFKSVTINDIHYYALYLVTWEYYFDYPEIFVDSHNYKNTHVFLFKDEDYNQLFDLPDDSIYRIRISGSSNFGTGGCCHEHRTESAMYEWFSANLHDTGKIAKGNWFSVNLGGNLLLQYLTKHLIINTLVN